MDTYVDIREPVEVINAFRELGFKPVKLATGDVVGGKVAIERKTPSDFLNSLKSGRLFMQVQEMVEEYPVCRIWVHGTLEDLLGLDTSMNPNAILGAIASCDRRGAPVLFYTELTNASYIINRLVIKYADDKDRSVLPVRKDYTNEERMIAIYSMLPGVGIKIAKSMSEEFPTLDNLLSMITSCDCNRLSKDEKIGLLTEIPKIGKKKAKAIYDFARGESNAEDENKEVEEESDSDDSFGDL